MHTLSVSICIKRAAWSSPEEEHSCSAQLGLKPAQIPGRVGGSRNELRKNKYNVQKLEAFSNYALKCTHACCFWLDAKALHFCAHTKRRSVSRGCGSSLQTPEEEHSCSAQLGLKPAQIPSPCSKWLWAGGWAVQSQRSCLTRSSAKRRG